MRMLPEVREGGEGGWGGGGGGARRRLVVQLNKKWGWGLQRTRGRWPNPRRAP